MLVVLLVLTVLLVVADRVGAHLAANVVAGKLQTSADLETVPKVSIKGFPFLTQALRGRYDQIAVEATDVSRGGVRLSELDTTLAGARIPFSDAISGRVTSVPVEGLTARVIATYADVSRVSGIVGLQIVPSGNGLKLTGRVTALGQTVSASALSNVTLSGNELVISAQSVSMAGQTNPLLNKAIAGRFDFRVKVGRLPYGLEFTTVSVDESGLVIAAATGPTVITAQ